MGWRYKMEMVTRKLVTIITEAVIEKVLIGELDNLRVSGYTITDARGKGHRGLRSAGWEHGANIRIEVICDEAMADSIAVKLKEQYYENYAMVLYVSDVRIMRPEKFQP